MCFLERVEVKGVRLSGATLKGLGGVVRLLGLGVEEEALLGLLEGAMVRVVGGVM